LRAMLPPGVLDSSRVRRYRKTAFRVPVAHWLRGPLAEPLRHQLEHGVIYEQGYFDRAAVARLTDAHLAGAADHSQELWPLLSLGLWADRFCGHDRSYVRD
jgi:asparagine synthase (glutamine-hydrolysing)